TDVDAAIARISSYKKVEGVLAVDWDGVAIRSTLSHEATLQHVSLITKLTKMARQTVKDLDGEGQDDLSFLRIRSKKHEIMVCPEEKYLLIVLQNPQER
ncbi:MAG: hypothetical protein DHS80DRAFT_17069, partial [Piptocephalis tieghemiana]